MNVLFLCPANGCDYQCDMVLHGFKTLYGNSVIDFPRVDYMYQGYEGLDLLYGRGFSLYGLLPNGPVDRDSIREKIRDHYFDLVIYGSIHRYQKDLQLVLSHYKRHEILMIDGEDQTHFLGDLATAGTYYKRELAGEHPDLRPIHFAIPSTKIGTLRQVPKNRVRAHIDPRDRSTYIYKDELSYYTDYASSLFAFTTKKSGWDCLRHYEIMANHCIPLFLDLDQCPHTTLMQLPKPELLEALSYIDREGPYWETKEGKDLWTSLHRRIHLRFACHSTTERLAQYLIDQYRIEAAHAA